MIVKVISEDNKYWIPTIKQFLEITKATGLQIKDNQDINIITNKLESAKKKDKENSWYFNIKFSIEVKSSTGVEPCNVRIIKNRGKYEDNCISCIIYSTKTDIVNDKNIDYNI